MPEPLAMHPAKHLRSVCHRHNDRRLFVRYARHNVRAAACAHVKDLARLAGGCSPLQHGAGGKLVVHVHSCTGHVS